MVVFTESLDSDLPVPILHIEQLASEVLPNLVSHPDQRDRITWIAHAPAKSYDLCGIKVGELFALVTFDDFLNRNDDRWGAIIHAHLPTCRFGWFCRPAWRRIQRPEVESLIGMEWA